MLVDNLSFSAAIGIALLALIAYIVAQGVYDLFFHPLRNFPGPKIAAVGCYYEFYYDVIKDGTYLWEIEKMHRKYGPIIRINSRSLHIHDPEYYATIYAGSGQRINKDPLAVAGYTFPHASISTIDHELHRKRRAIVSPYFSKRAVVNLEPVMHERLDVLCARLAATMPRGVTVDLTSALSAYTADVVTYHFHGAHPDHLGSKDFKYGLKDALMALLDFYNLTRFLPVPPTTIKNLPLPILRWFNPNFPLVVLAREDNKAMILKALSSDEETKAASKSVIISALADLDDPDIPPEEKSLDRLLDEGETLVFAGIDTTARALSVGMFHLLNEKKHLEKLRHELATLPKESDQAWSLVQLESLPFMRGVIQESLRLSYGLVVRIPRVAVEEPLQYKQYTIPLGTPVSQSTYLVNNDPSIFPNPHVFDPERWVRAAREGFNLDKYMVSFTKGSRACVGINLAYAELYLGIARVASSLDMDLVGTKQQDIDVYHTRAFSFPKEGSGAVMAKVTGVLR